VTAYPHRQQRLFDMFATNVDTDIEIRVIYGYVYENISGADALAKQPSGVRYMQQGLGSVIKRLNEKLTVGKIKPGITKQTYRFDTNA
jgi:hypothetical protein